MDKCGTDAEFDSYWDNEAKNQNRNRIRVGRQYQASIPPLLKPGQKDGRKSEELETLKWKPDQITDQAIEEYLSMAKGLGLFSKSLDSPKPSEKSDNSLQSAIKGLSEFVTSHHPCHHDDGCKVPQPSSSSSGESSSTSKPGDWSASEAQLFAQALESCGKNFGAIKKEYLPWKPIKSIIEYYYEGKGDKAEELAEACASAELSPKKEKSPSPSCSKDEKVFVKEEPSYGPAKVETPSPDPPKDSITFLENTRVTDPCKATPPPDVKMSPSESGTAPNLGSLKFFLGGRLVLKLNAQPDSGSGSKCQWVQSNELQKNHVKKERQQRKTEPQRPNNNNKKPSNDCDPSAVKKPRLKSEYDFAEKQGTLLCTSYWTPPIADGQEAMIEVDDGSSKNSEGYVSPVLSNPRLKSETYTDSASVSPVHTNSRFVDGSPVHSNSRFAKADDKTELRWSGDKADGSPVHSRYSKSEYMNDKLSSDNSPVHSRYPRTDNSSPIHNSRFSQQRPNDNLFPRTENASPIHNPRLSSPSNSRRAEDSEIGVRSSPYRSSDSRRVEDSETMHRSSDGSPFKPEVLNHKSALSHNRTYQRSSAALLKQWNKWPPSHAKRNASSPSLTTADLKSPLKENPLDLSGRLEPPSPPQSPPSSNAPPGVEGGSSESSSCGAYCQPYALNKCSKDYSSSLEEVPLDLSSANESLKEKNADSEKLSENANATVTDNSAAVEKGMLYQLLKNKTSK